ncbi:hypothetical protein Tco_0620416, partial [Tanacetum coccineum]
CKTTFQITNDPSKTPQEFLVALGLSHVWDDDYFKPVIEDAPGNVLSMARFLRLPTLEGVKINREPMYDEDTSDQPTFTQVDRDCTRAPAGPDDVLPRLTSEQDVFKKRKLAANDELSKSPSTHSQQEKGDASIDAIDNVVRSPDVFSPRGDQLTEVLSDGCSNEGSRPSPSMLFEPEWKISPHDRYNTNSICRDMLLHLSTPAERVYQRSFSYEDAIRRGFTKSGMAMSVVTDLFNRGEDLLASHEKLKGKYKELQGKHDKLLAKHEGLYGRHQEKKKEHEAQVFLFHQEKKDWLSLKDFMTQKIKDQKDKIAFLESEKEKAVGNLLPTVVSCLFKSEEYQKSHVNVQSLAYSVGYLTGLKTVCSSEEYENVVTGATHLDMDAPRTFEAAFDDLFDTTYPYITRVSAIYPSSVAELLDIHPKYAEPDSPPAN